MAEFQKVSLSDIPTVRIREISQSGKMTKVEIQLELDLPTSVIRKDNGQISLPMWAIKNAMK